MSIYLGSLSLSQGVLTKNTQVDTKYKIDADKIKADFQSIRESNSDLLLQGNVTESDISEIYTGTVDRSCNYSYNVFFTGEMPALANEDGSYTIGGVNFTEQELKEYRAVLQGAVSSIGENGINMDYRNHAHLAIALSGIKAYAQGNLNDEQSRVIINAMKEYNSSVVALEQELLSGDGFVDTSYGEFSEYYGKGKAVTQQEADGINELIGKMNELNTKKRTPVSEGYVITVSSATNSGLINEITQLFENMDYNDSESINTAMEKYKELMTPAYKASGFKEDNGSLSRILNKDIKEFMSQIRSVSAYFNYHSLDISL